MATLATHMDTLRGLILADAGDFFDMYLPIFAVLAGLGIAGIALLFVRRFMVD